jgi:Protein of unknown function (DUF3455)
MHKPLTSPYATVMAALLILGVVGCATATFKPPLSLPAAIAVPTDQVPLLEALAVGVQIYECEAGASETAPAAWKFRAPEATLTDRSGKPLGTHDAGPTWESADGSKVVGQVRASDAAPQAGAIPWLALTAKSVSGQGVFARTTHIQRVATAGGVTPKEPCGTANVKQMVRVPYTATYYFYRAP